MEDTCPSDSIQTELDVQELIKKGNRKYVKNFPEDLVHASEEATGHFAILTCMDSRIDPNDFAGLNPGVAYVLRNGGGRATEDMIRSLVLSTRLFGVDEYYVVHHTDCGLEKVTDPEVRSLLRENLGPCTIEGGCEHSGRGNRDKFHQSDYVAFLAFEDLKQSVIDDVHILKNHPLVSKHVKVYGYIYDVHTGKLCKVKVRK